MHVRGRRALCAALFSTLLLPAAPSHATCIVEVPLCGPLTDLGGGTGGEGVICGYVKYYAPPPSDWTGAPQSAPPYVFERTQAWGNAPQHAFDWNARACPPACTVQSQPRLLVVPR